MINEWMKELAKEENIREFSELVHNYFKLATMRVMQFIRNKYKVPPDDITKLTRSIFARFLNESCYALGSNIKDDCGINDIYSEEHLLNLIKVLNGESLKQSERTDIDTDIQSGLEKFKKFIEKNGSDFYHKNDL